MGTDVHAALARREVVVGDDLPLRRAELVAFLRPWSRSAGVRLVELPLAALEELSWPREGCRMVIIVSGNGLRDSAALRAVSKLNDAAQDMPVVLLSYASGLSDAALGIRCGARGYIPATTDPEVALRALTFVLGGGHFFPPEALQVQTLQQRPSRTRAGESPARPVILVTRGSVPGPKSNS